MQRVDTTSSIGVIPGNEPLGSPGYFTKGDPTLAVAATVPGQDWFNSVQEEICYPISQAGLTLDKTDRTQLYQAIMQLTYNPDQGVRTIDSPTFASVMVKNTATIGYQLGTDNAALTLGGARTDNGASFIDLVGDTTYSGYGLRILRNATGPDAASELAHRGLGSLILKTLDAAAISFVTANSTRGYVDSNGVWFLNNNGSGVGPPSFLARSTGTRIVIWDAHNGGIGTLTDGAFGYASNELWASVPDTARHFSWYAGETEIARLGGSGTLRVNGVTPLYMLWESDADTDKKYSELRCDAGVFKGSFHKDDYLTRYDWLTVTKTLHQAQNIDLNALGTLRYNGNNVWTAGNDGAGSGLDADLLRGLAPTAAATASTAMSRDGANHTAVGSVSLTTAAPATPIANALYPDLIPKAWVYFYETSPGVPIIGNSVNVSSVTRVSVGRYKVTFATPMASQYYAVSIEGSITRASHHVPKGAMLLSSFEYFIYNATGALTDQGAGIIVHGTQ